MGHEGAQQCQNVYFSCFCLYLRLKAAIPAGAGKHLCLVRVATLGLQ